MRILWIAAMALLLSPARPAEGGRLSRDELIQGVDSIAYSSLRKGPIAGMSIAVVRGADVLLARGYGFADVESAVPATEHTVYRIGSITKQFTAAAVFQLVERGKIRLDDDIRGFLPGYDTHGDTITIRHLLNHTSGIRSFTEVPAFQARERFDFPPESLLALFQHEPLDFPPGTSYAYNNSAYYLLGLIIQRASGQPYGDYLREHVFAPLGLRETFSCDDAPIIPHRAHGYSVSDGKLENAPYLSMLPPTAGGSLCSTVLDLVTWTHALAAGRLIRHESYAQMTTPTRLSDGRTVGYGYGLGLSTLAGHPEIAHAGTINGFSGYSAFYPRDSLTVVVLTNTLGPPIWSGEIARPIARLALSLPPETPQPLSPGERARDAGIYRVGTIEAKVTAEQDTLRVEVPPDRAAYRYLGKGVFALEGSPEIRLRFSGRGSRADRLTFEIGATAVYDLVREP